MSYDLWLKCGHCRHYVDVTYDSPTYNYGPMIRKADRLAGGNGASFGIVDGMPSYKAVKWFTMVLDAARDHLDEVLPLQPTNGWGTYQELLEIFESYIQLCIENPLMIWGTGGDGDEYTDSDRAFMDVPPPEVLTKG